MIETTASGSVGARPTRGRVAVRRGGGHPGRVGLRLAGPDLPPSGIHQGQFGDAERQADEQFAGALASGTASTGRRVRFSWRRPVSTSARKAPGRCWTPRPCPWPASQAAGVAARLGRVDQVAPDATKCRPAAPLPVRSEKFISLPERTGLPPGAKGYSPFWLGERQAAARLPRCCGEAGVDDGRASWG
jgi:hypothetical protein